MLLIVFGESFRSIVGGFVSICGNFLLSLQRCIRTLVKDHFDKETTLLIQFSQFVPISDNTTDRLVLEKSVWIENN